MEKDNSNEPSSKAAIGKAVAAAFITAVIIKLFILDLMVVDGHSMDPVIKPGTMVIVCRIFYGAKLPGIGDYFIQWRVPREGEIVVFYTPLGEIAVKRLGEALEDGFMAYGDNNTESYDSRDYGPVPYENIIGRVLGIR